MGSFKKLIVCVIMAVSMFSLSAPPAMAAAKVTASSNKIGKAKKVKIGTTYVTVKKSSAYDSKDRYLKFAAPKSGRYKITFSNIKSVPGKKKDFNCGSIAISKILYKTSKEPSSVKIKTKGGSTYFLYVCSKFMNSLNKDKKIDKYSYLPSRTASISLKKGETIWIQMSFVEKTTACKLVIKKG